VLVTCNHACHSSTLTSSIPLQKREGLAKQLLSAAPTRTSSAALRTTPTGAAAGAGGKGGGLGPGGALAVPRRGKVVYRHLVDGDLLLTNRQPTLHKPGLMAHK
jgi:DNA-directed RNA polymerase I subunit RPA1